MNKENLIFEICLKTEGLLKDWQGDIEKAYLKLDDRESLPITMTHKLKPEGPQKIKVESSISFVAEKVSDKVTYFIDDKQIPMTFNEKQDSPK